MSVNNDNKEKPNKISVAPLNVAYMNELGTSGLRQSGGFVYEDFLARMQWPYVASIYAEMSNNDPVITAMLLMSKQLIRNVSWQVKAASDSPADQEAAEFLRECVKDIEGTWLDFIDEVLSYFEYGWSLHEIVYKRRDGYSRNPKKHSKYNDKRIGWRKLAGRAQNTLSRWQFDSDGTIVAMEQQADAVHATIPMDRCLLFRTTTSKNNPEGRSFLRGAYRSWYFKKHIEEIEGIGIERDLAGLPVLTAPEGVDIFSVTSNPEKEMAKQSAMRIVSSIRNDRNAGIVLPAGWELKLLSAGSTRQFDTSAIINRYDQRIAITMLADIVMLGADKVGSFALAKVKQSMLATALDAQLASVVDILNEQAVPRLFSYNVFPGITEYPRFVTGTVVAPDLKELGDYVEALSKSNMALFPDENLEDYLRTVASLPNKTVGTNAKSDSTLKEEQKQKTNISKER